MITFISKEPINKGWSCDSKYSVTTVEGKKYLLRITQKKIVETGLKCFACKARWQHWEWGG